MALWHRSAPTIAVVIAVLLSAGCAGSSPAQSETMQPILEPRGVPDEGWHPQPPTPELEERTAALLEEPLDVDDALRVALLNHPRLQADLQQLRATRASAFQEALVANPQADAEVLFGDHTKIESQLTFDVGSLLHLALRRDIARGESERAVLEAAQSTIDLMHEVRMAYYDYVADRQRLELQRHVLEAVRASAVAAEQLREAGNITEFELVTQQAFASEMRLSVIDAEATAEASREPLRQMMGLRPDRDDWVVAERLPELPDEEPDVDALAERATANSLTLARLQEQMMVRQTEASLTRWKGWVPRIDAGVAGEYEQERLLIGPTVGVTLPLFDRRSRTVDALRAEALGLTHRRQAVTGRIHAQARSVARQLEAADEAARHLDEEVIPLHERAAQEALRQFNAMEIGVFELLDTRQAQVRVGHRYVDALATYWKYRAHATHLLAGGSLH